MPGDVPPNTLGNALLCWRGEKGELLILQVESIIAEKAKQILA
jgi:hypothetical protein